MKKLDNYSIPFIFLAFFCFACSGKAQHQGYTDEIVAGQLTSYFPNYVLNKAENKWTIKDYDSLSAEVFYFKELALYRVFYIHEKIERLNGVVISKPVIEYLFYDLVVSDQSSFVFRFDSTGIENGVLIRNKDSVIQKQPILGFNVDKIFSETYFNLISAINNSNGSQEKYSIVAKNDTAQNGSITLFFSKDELNDFPYSLGREVERMKGMRLIKAIVTTDGRFMNPGNYYLAEAIIPTSIKQIYLSEEKKKGIKQIFDWVTKYKPFDKR